MGSVLYLTTSPEPPLGGTDAILNEIDLLCREFDGQILPLYPFRRAVRKFPAFLIGSPLAMKLRRLQQQHTVNHLYFPTLYPFPILRLLSRPTVYSVSASLDPRQKPGSAALLRSLHKIVVSNERDAATLTAWGFDNHALIPPGIPTCHIVPRARRVASDFTILLASAPWHATQFDLKGVDAILGAARRLPQVRFIFLWRGLLVDELRERVAKSGAAARIHIINQKHDINECLANADATILLTKRANIVKAYPHSLVESLAANRPVIVSETIPMADYVRRHNCGITVSEVTAEAVLEAVTALRADYDGYADRAGRLAKPAFPTGAFIDAHRRIYSGDAVRDASDV